MRSQISHCAGIIGTHVGTADPTIRPLPIFIYDNTSLNNMAPGVMRKLLCKDDMDQIFREFVDSMGTVALIENKNADSVVSSPDGEKKYRVNKGKNDKDIRSISHKYGMTLHNYRSNTASSVNSCRGGAGRMRVGRILDARRRRIKSLYRTTRFM